MSRKLLRTNNIFWCILTFCAWAWASILWSAHPDASIGRFINLSLLVGSYFLLINLTDSENKFNLLLAAYVSGCSVGALLAAKTFLTTHIVFSHRTRMALSGQNPNTMGATMGLAFLFSCYLLSKTKKPLYRLIIFLTSMLFLFVLIMSQSRGSWVAFIIAISFYFWPIIKKANPRTLLTFPLVAACIITFIFSLPFLFPERASFLEKRFLSIFDASKSLTARPNIWRVGIEMWKDNPILGVGLNNFPKRFNEYCDITSTVTHYPGSGRDPHSVYLSMICELGLIGFAFFCSILYSCLIRLRGNEQALKAFMFAIFVFILMISSKGTIVWNKYYWLTIGLIGATSNFGKQSDQFTSTDSLKQK